MSLGLGINSGESNGQEPKHDMEAAKGLRVWVVLEFLSFFS